MNRRLVGSQELGHESGAAGVPTPDAYTRRRSLTPLRFGRYAVAVLAGGMQRSSGVDRRAELVQDNEFGDRHGLRSSMHG
jgi:hypothetical protein